MVLDVVILLFHLEGVSKQAVFHHHLLLKPQKQKRNYFFSWYNGINHIPWLEMGTKFIYWPFIGWTGPSRDSTQRRWGSKAVGLPLSGCQSEKAGLWSNHWTPVQPINELTWTANPAVHNHLYPWILKYECILLLSLSTNIALSTTLYLKFISVFMWWNNTNHLPNSIHIFNSNCSSNPCLVIFGAFLCMIGERSLRYTI